MDGWTDGRMDGWTYFTFVFLFTYVTHFIRIENMLRIVCIFVICFTYVLRVFTYLAYVGYMLHALRICYAYSYFLHICYEKLAYVTPILHIF